MLVLDAACGRTNRIRNNFKKKRLKTFRITCRTIDRHDVVVSNPRRRQRMDYGLYCLVLSSFDFCVISRFTTIIETVNVVRKGFSPKKNKKNPSGPLNQNNGKTRSQLDGSPPYECDSRNRWLRLTCTYPYESLTQKVKGKHKSTQCFYFTTSIINFYFGPWILVEMWVLHDSNYSQSLEIKRPQVISY